MCARLVEPLPRVFQKLLLTNQSILQDVQFSVACEGCSQGDWCGCTTCACFCLGTDIVELGLYFVVGRPSLLSLADSLSRGPGDH